MTAFLISYIIVAVAVTISVFVMSKHSEQKPRLKTVLLIVCILAIIALVFATGCLEVKYGWSRLKSSIPAAIIILAIYGADVLGMKAANKDD